MRLLIKKKTNVNVDSAIGRGVDDALKGKKVKNPFSDPILRESYQLGYDCVPEQNRGKISESPHSEDIAALIELDVRLQSWTLTRADESKAFICDKCNRWTPVENGAADDMPDSCDSCWCAEHDIEY